MDAVFVDRLSKVYPVAVKDPGWRGMLRHFFQRTYRPIVAVDEVSFRIAPGEVVGFLGPNGAGKTTTLKMLSGLIYPTSGEVRVAGCLPFRRERAFLQKIALVMGQKQQLIWDLPALDSLAIDAAIYDIPDRLFAQRVEELSSLLGLEGKLRQPVRKLSLGERMKAELLAALLHHPQILFLDEPTLGLDVNAQASMREFLREYNRRYGATILLTSHYMADITALCRRVVLIHQGRAIYDGDLEHLLDRFAPYREVRLDLADPHPNDRVRQQLAGFGEVAAWDGSSVRLMVRRDALTAVVSRILSEIEVVDLTVADPPVEETIGRVFATGSAQREGVES